MPKLPYQRQIRSGKGRNDPVPGEHGLYHFEFEFPDYVVDGKTMQGEYLAGLFSDFAESSIEIVGQHADKWGIPGNIIDPSKAETFIASTWWKFDISYTNKTLEGTETPDWEASKFVGGGIHPRSFVPGVAAAIGSATEQLSSNGDYLDVQEKLKAQAVDSEYIFIKFIGAHLYFATLPFTSGKTPLISSFGRQFFQRGMDEIRREKLDEQQKAADERERLRVEYEEKLAKAKARDEKRAAKEAAKAEKMKAKKPEPKPEPKKTKAKKPEPKKTKAKKPEPKKTKAKKPAPKPEPKTKAKKPEPKKTKAKKPAPKPEPKTKAKKTKEKVKPRRQVSKPEPRPKKGKAKRRDSVRLRKAETAKVKAKAKKTKVKATPSVKVKSYMRGGKKVKAYRRN